MHCSLGLRFVCDCNGLGNEGLYDTSSHAFEVHVDTSSHGRRGAVAVGVIEGYLDHCGHM